MKTIVVSQDKALFERVLQDLSERDDCQIKRKTDLISIMNELKSSVESGILLIDIDTTDKKTQEFVIKETKKNDCWVSVCIGEKNNGFDGYFFRKDNGSIRRGFVALADVICNFRHIKNMLSDISFNLNSMTGGQSVSV